MLSPDCSNSRVKRLAVIASHPVQYQTPVFDALARRVETDVYFALPDQALGESSLGQNTHLRWDVQARGHFKGYYLNNVANHPSPTRFTGCDTPGIGELLSRGNYHGCIVFGWFLKTYWQVAWACRQAKLPLLVITDSHQRSQSRRGIMNRAKAHIRRQIWRLFDGFGVPGQWAESFILSQGIQRNKIFKIPHSVDVNRFGETLDWDESKRTLVRQRLGISSNAFVIMGCGKLVTLKRFQDLLQATQQLPKHLKENVHVLLVGEGPQRANLQALASAQNMKVTITGFCNQSQMPSMYAVADCFVLCSNYETWGLVVNESLASGVPSIVSSNVGSGLDLIEQQAFGRIYPVGDISELAKSIQSIHAQISDCPPGMDLRQHIAQSVQFCSPDNVAQLMFEAMCCLSSGKHDVRSAGNLRLGV